MIPGVSKKRFLLRVHLVAVLHLSLLSRKVLRSRGREEVVAIAVMPQCSKGDISNNLTVYLYKLPAFRILVIVWIYITKPSFAWVKWVENVSLSKRYPRKTRSIRMYSVVYPESNFGGFSGMVPEWFHISSGVILGLLDEDPILSRFKCQNLCFSICSAQQLHRGGHLSAQKNMSVLRIAYSWKFRKVYVCVP